MAETTETPGAALARRLKADRIARRMRWKAYAEFLGVKMSTLQKIVRLVTDQPQELTVAQLEQRMAIPVGDEAKHPHPGPGLTPANQTA